MLVFEPHQSSRCTDKAHFYPSPGETAHLDSPLPSVNIKRKQRVTIENFGVIKGGVGVRVGEGKKGEKVRPRKREEGRIEEERGWSKTPRESTISRWVWGKSALYVNQMLHIFTCCCDFTQ